MTPEAKRIAIAEVCGWEDISSELGVEFRASTRGGFVYLRDPLNDLNAMHEAEKRLTPAQWNAYVNHLDGVVAGDDVDRLQPMTDFRFCTATAAQRAEAFLRTIGKWEETR